MNVTDILNEEEISNFEKAVSIGENDGQNIKASYKTNYYKLINIGQKKGKEKGKDRNRDSIIKIGSLGSSNVNLEKEEKVKDKPRRAEIIRKTEIIIKEYNYLKNTYKPKNDNEKEVISEILEKFEPQMKKARDNVEKLKEFEAFKKRDKTASDNAKYEAERIKKTDARKTNGKVDYGNDKTKKLASMMAKNNFDWNFFTTSFYGKDDMTKLAKAIPMPSGTMLKQKATEIKHMPQKDIKDKSIRFSNFISLSTAGSFMAFYNEYKKIKNKEITKEDFAKNFNSWIDYIYKKELISVKGNALARKILSDNKDKMVQAGGFKKTLEFAAKKAKFSFKLENAMKPGIPKEQKEKYKGIIFPKVKRVDIAITVPEDAYKVENSLINFTREILNG